MGEVLHVSDRCCQCGEGIGVGVTPLGTRGRRLWRSCRCGGRRRKRLLCLDGLQAEQKARSTYDNLLRLCRDDPDVYEPLKFLREREVVHFQRFGEAMSIIQSKLDSKNFYAYNPEFKK